MFDDERFAHAWGMIWTEDEATGKHSTLIGEPVAGEIGGVDLQLAGALADLRGEPSVLEIAGLPPLAEFMQAFKPQWLIPGWPEDWPEMEGKIPLIPWEDD
jgi:hypothetical protein